MQISVCQFKPLWIQFLPQGITSGYCFHGFIISYCKDSLMETHMKKNTNWHNDRKASPHTVSYVGCNTACYSQGAEKKTFKTTESKHKWPLVGMNTHVCLAEGMKHFPKPAFLSKRLWWLICKYTDFSYWASACIFSQSRNIHTQNLNH